MLHIFYILANVFLRGGRGRLLHCCTGFFSIRWGGMQMLAGLAPFSQTEGFILRTPRLAKLTGIIAKIACQRFTIWLFFPTQKLCLLSLIFGYCCQIPFFTEKHYGRYNLPLLLLKNSMQMNKKCDCFDKIER